MISAVHQRFQALAMIVVLALLSGALVPAGFMPGTGQDGKVAVVICTGHGSVVKMVDRADLPLAAHKGDGADASGDVPEPGAGDGGQTPFTCPYAPVLTHYGAVPLPELPVTFAGRDAVLPSPGTAFSGVFAVKPWYGQAPPAARV